MTKDREIKITCKAAEMLDIDTLEHFQDKLKVLPATQAVKVRESILRHGIAFPVFVWRGNGGTMLIDGHQRVAVLKEMLEEGYTLPGGKVPAAIVEATSVKEAKEKVLLAASRYGRIDQDGLVAFMDGAELDLSSMIEIADLPDIYLELSELDMRGGEEDKPELLDKFGESRKSDKNTQWFYVEYYKDEDTYNRVKDAIQEHVNGSRQMDPVWFARLVGCGDE